MDRTEKAIQNYIDNYNRICMADLKEFFGVSSDYRNFLYGIKKNIYGKKMLYISFPKIKTDSIIILRAFREWVK